MVGSAFGQNSRIFRARTTASDASSFTQAKIVYFEWYKSVERAWSCAHQFAQIQSPGPRCILIRKLTIFSVWNSCKLIRRRGNSGHILESCPTAHAANSRRFLQSRRDSPRSRQAGRQRFVPLEKSAACSLGTAVSGRFDDGYFSGVRAIGLIHNRIGLEPRWYIGGYNFVLARLIEAATENYRSGPGKLKEALLAISSVIMLDMDIAISVYQEALLAQTAQRGVRLDSLLQTFDGTAQALLGSVAAAGTQMFATAQAMSANATQTRGQSASVASASEEASVNVQTVASAAEELSARSRRFCATFEFIRHGRSSSPGSPANQCPDGSAGRKRREDQRRRAINSGHRRADQFAGAECHYRGRSRRGVSAEASLWSPMKSKTSPTRPPKRPRKSALAVNQIQSATKNADAAIHSIGATIEELSSNAALIADGVEQQGEATRKSPVASRRPRKAHAWLPPVFSASIKQPTKRARPPAKCSARPKI